MAKQGLFFQAKYPGRRNDGRKWAAAPGGRLHSSPGLSQPGTLPMTFSQGLEQNSPTGLKSLSWKGKGFCQVEEGSRTKASRQKGTRYLDLIKKKQQKPQSLCSHCA